MADDKILDKVRALLAKAAGTEYPAEAEAFLAKAEALMARHAIDQAMLDNSDRSNDEPAMRVIRLGAPYPVAKAILLQEIAVAHRCQSVYGYGPDRNDAHVFGFQSDLDAVELLFASLLAHGVRTMLAETPVGNTRSFRNSFLQQYAWRIGERLQAARRVAEREYESETGVSSGLVLAGRDDMVRSVMPSTVSRRTTSSGRGGRAGRSAANSADLGQQRVAGGVRGAIGG